MTAFGPWLRSRRLALRLTQAELASRVGCARDALRQFESEARRPSLQLAERLADALDIPADERAAFIEAARSSRESRPPLPDEAPAATAHTPPHPPEPQIELIGRAAERGAVLAELRDGRHRLITLVGPGGAGKTSLALQVAADLSADPRDAYAAAVVLLAPVGAVSDVLPAIAEALGHSQEAGPVWDLVVAALRERAVLLVLDNCEHLLGPGDGEELAALLLRLFEAAPDLRVLATSRERLRLRGEQVIELGGLAVPTADTSARVDRSDAVRLFVERAQRVSPGFALGADNRAAVAQICRRLEGLPLAIELAASWTRVLSPPEIAAEIDRSLDFLAASERDAPARHRSLRAALDHSWQLLGGREREMLARLSVFRGGFDRSAAWDVAGATLPDLMALIDKSLIHRVEQRGAARFALHELVRQYAEERLSADAGAQRATIARHAAHYSALLSRSIAAQTGGSSPEAWANVSRNIDNVRAAWVRAAADGDEATVHAMARGLMILYDHPGWVQEGAALFERAVAALRAAGVTAGAALGVTLGFQGYFLQLLRPAAGASLLEAAVALLEQAGDTVDRAQFLLHLGTGEIAAARFDAAHERYALASELATARGDHYTRLYAIFYQGVIAVYRGDLTAAERHLTSCLADWRIHGFKRGIASALNWLSEVMRQAGRHAEALAFAREGLQISSTAHDRPGIARALRELGALALERNDLEEAGYLLAESVTMFRAIGSPWVYGRSRSLLVQLEVRQGRYAAAREGCAELLRQLGDGVDLMLPEAILGLGLLLAAEGSDTEALAVLAALGEAPGERLTLTRIAELRAEIEGRLDPARRAAAQRMARERPLLPWLEELCARPTPVAAAAPEPPAGGAPIVPAGALFVAATGETLSPREVEVLRLLARGASNAAIAAELIISLHTAKHHVAHVLQKLGVSKRTEAAIRARELGLVE